MAMDSFVAARPVWLVGRHAEMNLMAGFRCRIVVAENAGHAVLRVTARTAYRAWVDGRFAGCGPARSAHGHARVDAWDMASLRTPGTHLVAIEVSAANVPGYAMTDEPPFLQAEVTVDGQVLAATGSDTCPHGWEGLIPGERVQRVQRLSRQRGFAEAWRLGPHSLAWRRDLAAAVATHSVEEVAGAILLPRWVPLPHLGVVAPLAVVAGGTIHPDADGTLRPWERWLVEQSGHDLAGYRSEEWEAHLSEDLSRLGFTREPLPAGAASDTLVLGDHTWTVVDFGVNRSGFLKARLRCTAPAVVYLLGDEFLTEGDVDARRLEYFPGVRYELAPGQYDLESFEVVTCRYLKIAVLGAEVAVEALSMREYARPTMASFAAADPALNRIFGAAERTFAQNAVDIFLDCPSRERAGWLCDSFFTARVEPWLTGGCLAEQLFLENYALVPPLPDLPPGMLPKCYPAEGFPGRSAPHGAWSNYIPNWPLWLVLEVGEHPQRGGDPGIVAARERKVADLFAFFETYRNADGLLERLDKWVFVDWSDANKHVQDVNYPTNMLYAAALEAAGRFYGRPSWIAQAAAVRQQVLRQSWDGRYFVDNAQRDPSGRLVATGHHTEACQYYAFFFGLATPESHPALWRDLLENTSLAPGAVHPHLPQAGALPAQHLRMALLARFGQVQRLVDEVRACFLPMAERTGTFWEHEHCRNSCNHGFASHVAHLLMQEVLGVRIDWHTRQIHLRIPDIDLPWCHGRIPLGDGWLETGWERTASGPRLRVERVPAGWSVTPSAPLEGACEGARAAPACT